MGLFSKDRDLATAPDRVELPVRASDFGLRVEDVSFRLDNFLSERLHWRSRTSVQRLIREGSVLVDVPVPDRPARGEPTVERRVSRRLVHGSLVVVIIPEELRLEISPYATEELCIVYEDDELLCVDKPPGLTVHPAGRHLTDTLIQRVHARYRAETPDGVPGKVPIKLCHRLDRETSGLVLLGKNAASHTAMMQAFENRRVQKEYLAIVRGVPERDAGSVEYDLGPALASEVRIKMAPVADGLPARTEWEVLERHADCTLLLCRPHTGRQHQIRVHLDAIGYPLVGDKLYGVDERTFLRNALGELGHREMSDLELPRHALHNHSLTFAHPRTGEELRIECPLAPDLRAYLNRLDQR